MPLSAAERQRRYKEKMKKDPEKYEKYKRKKRENYHSKKKLVKDLTSKEKYNARVIWKLRKQNLRRKRKNLNNLLEITPPSSPSILERNVDLPLNVVQMSPKHNDIMIGMETPENSVASSNVTRKNAGRKKIRKDRSKLYRENLRLQEENEKLKKKFEKYKKRCQRLEYKNKEEIETNEEDKYKKLSNAIKEKYQNIRKHKEKQKLKDIFENIEDAQKKQMIKDTLGITGPIRTTIKVHNSKNILKRKIDSFFQRQDVSRCSAGKKETITRHGQKVQKIYLLDNMKNLHKTFLLENPGMKCSYYYFTRNKPFYVVKPTVSGREMCLCKTHINPTYKASALKLKNIINTDDMNELISATVCNPKEKACMYGTCSQCRDLEIKPNDVKDNSKIQWKEWARVAESYEKEGKIIKVFKNIKQDKEGTVKELTTEFNKELKILKKHIHNMKVQFANFRCAVENLQNTEACIVADFSENYSCKQHEEIQAHHFGGSREQVSLHTVVVYVKDGENNKKVESFCTVSSDTNHKPAAIWAHLIPVLMHIKRSYPEITFIHFFTDGPFSQYRQKQNFYLSSTILFDYGFKAMTWSFFEAGHGKGPADGIGGYLKRSADDLVATGQDITNAYTFYEALKDISKVILYLILTEDIENIATGLSTNIQALPGTKDVHQVFTAIRGELKYRNLSCFCSRGFCDCFSPQIYQPLATVSEEKIRKRKNMKDKSVRKGKVNENEGLFINESKDDRASSDEDQPLSSYSMSAQEKSPLKEIGFRDLSQARSKNWYNIVYKTSETSDEETVANDGQPSTSMENKENRGVRCGDFLLVNVKAVKGKIFKYACIVDDLHDDGEIRVSFMRSAKKENNTFRLEENDVSDIDYTDIVQILPEPKIITKRGQKYYVFENNVNVFEK